MPRQPRFYLFFSLMLWLAVCPVRADKLFVRNQPFKGVVRGTGTSSMVELAPFVQALGLTIKPCNGGFLVTTDPKSDQGSEVCEAGQAVVDGNKISVITGTGGETLVSLSELCGCVGAKLVVNRDMGSLDVYLESKAKLRGPSIKDNWNASSAQPVRSKVSGSSKMPEGPGKVGVQFFESFGLLPPCRDVKEMSQLCRKQADIDRFYKAYKNAVTPELYAKTYPGLSKAVDKVVEVSLLLSNVPLEDLERYMASKPEVAKKFTESMVSWETMRSTTATLSDQETRGHEALLKVDQNMTDPVTGKVKTVKIILHLVQSGVVWKIDRAQTARTPGEGP